MLGRFGRDAGSLLGVEIASDTIRMLQLRRQRGHWRVAAWACEPITRPMGHSQLPEALREAHRRCGTPQRRVALALPSSQVICKVCQLPAETARFDAEVRLLAQAEQLFPSRWMTWPWTSRCWGCLPGALLTSMSWWPPAGRASLTLLSTCSTRRGCRWRPWRSTASPCCVQWGSKRRPIWRYCSWRLAKSCCMVGSVILSPASAPGSGCIGAMARERRASLVVAWRAGASSTSDACRGRRGRRASRAID